MFRAQGGIGQWEGNEGMNDPLSATADDTHHAQVHQWLCTVDPRHYGGGEGLVCKESILQL